MLKKSFLIATVFGVAYCGVGLAQAPVVNIGTRHGNLRNAQEHLVQAYQYINKAQAANDDQLGGHAQKAKDLLVQADQELRMAANVSNSEGR